MTYAMGLLGAGLLGAAGLVGGCDDLGAELEEDVEEVLDSGLLDANIDDLTKIPICGDMSLEDLATSDTITDSCRDGIASYLPDEQTSFEDVILALGTETAEDGSLSVFLQGADGAGAALNADDFASATVSVTIDGEVTVLAEGDFTVTLVADVPRDLAAIAVVNDYSGSMLVEDLETVAQIETDLFTLLPPIYEAQVVAFSTEVTVQQDYTTDRNDLLAAVAYDASYERESTALYDGVGSALEELTLRDRPIRLLMVSTDGHENASKDYTQAELVQTIDENGILVVMLGALLADVDELRTLSGNRGVYFYTPYYSDMRELMSGYFDSLEELVELTLPPDYADADSIEIEVGDQSTTVEP